jgi:hypothetical protein
MDRLNPRRWWQVSAVAVLAVALAGVAPPAFAEDEKDAGGEGTASWSTAVPAPISADLSGAASDPGGERGSEGAEGVSSVTEYWTAERMEQAIPADPPSSDSPPGDASARSLPSVVEGTQPLSITAEPVPAADAPDRPVAEAITNLSHTNGKVFFRNQSDGLDYVCSGSAVASASKRLVVTAGHCVHGGPGGTWHANWVFAPGYDHGPGPHGTFQSATFRVLDDWTAFGATAGGFNSDVAFVTTNTNELGQTVVDAVGGHGLSNGGEHVFDASLFGYPVNLESGQVMSACAGTTEPRSIGFAYLFVSISGCNFGGGASGGPWLHQYNNATGLGYVRSVSSFGPSDSTEFISGPYFDQRVPDLYVAADGDGRR